MQDGTTDPATRYTPVQTLGCDKETMLPDAATDPAPAPAPISKNAGPALGRRTTWLLCIACAVGLALGVLLTNLFNNMLAYTYFYPVNSNKTSVEVFNELNQMRVELNQLNEAKKLKEQDKDEAVRQALSAVRSVVPPESGQPSVVSPAMPPGGGGDVRPVNKPRDGFAEIDEEIERLEKTQKTINKILDLFTPPTQEKEPKKDR